MTLSKLTTAMMIVSFLVIFVGTLTITIYHTKTYFEEQMVHTAQDTATALGLSMSKLANKTIDATTMLLSVSAVFDRGNFSSILVRNTEGKVLVKRYLKEIRYSAPNWFVKIVVLNNKEGSALIMQGWRQIGEVLVRSDDAVAYTALWNTTKKLFMLFLLMMALILFVSLLLIKTMFRSLGKIVQQADDIGKKNLYTLDKLPKLKELRLLSITMNSMVTKLKLFFSIQIEEAEQLRAKAYQDSLTGKGNRRYFFQQFSQYLSSEDGFLPGFLFLIELRGLAEFNIKQGYQEGDQVIIGVAQCLDSLFLKHSVYLLARLDGPSFAVVIFGQDRALMETLGKDINLLVDQLIKAKNSELSVAIGIVPCQFGEPATNLLTAADNLLKEVNKKGGGYCIASDMNTELPQSNKSWLSKIEKAIEAKTFRFYWQPVKAKEETYHKECFIKLLNGKNEIQAQYFFPIVEQYSLGGEIDQLVFKEIIKIKASDTVALNLSSSTVGDEKKQKGFLSLVTEWAKAGHMKIHFEFSEYILGQHMASAVKLVNALVKLGYKVGLDRVGTTLIPLTYLDEINLAYVKLDADLSKNITKDKVKQEVLANWITTTERLDIILIATAIESESQWRSLSDLGVIYFQGNYIQTPRELDLLTQKQSK